MTCKLVETMMRCGVAWLAGLGLVALAAPATAEGNPFAPAAGRPSSPSSAPTASPTSPNPFAAVLNKAATTPPATAPTPPVALPAAAASATTASVHTGPGLVSLEQKNVFDPDRKMWPDRVPPPPPPPPPPAPPPVTEQDLQLYGTVLVGPVKRATVRLGGRFASIAQGGRPYAQLTEGQALGEYTVSQIQPLHIVLSAAGAQQTIVFTKKTDRPAASLVPPVIQAAAVSASPSPTPTPAVAPQQAPTDTAAPNTASASAPAPVAPAAPSAAPQATPFANNADSGPGTPAPPPNSLAAAIAAAQAAAAQGNRPPTVNPFLPTK